MYRSLYEEIKPLIFNGESGTLSIDCEYGESARIILNEGLIEGVYSEKAEGKQALETIAKWVSFSTRFSQGERGDRNSSITIDTNSFLSILEKVHKIIQKINSVIPSNNAIFKGDTSKVDKHKRFSSVDLKVMMLLDGKRPLKQVVPGSGYSELDVLISIFRLVSSGIVKFLSDDIPMPDKEREAFLESLSSKLTGYVGPAAAILVNDAFQTLGHGSEMLTLKEIPIVIESVSDPLEKEERELLTQWSLDYLQK
jgi:hypothetical protein